MIFARPVVNSDRAPGCSQESECSRVRKILTSTRRSVPTLFNSGCTRFVVFDDNGLACNRSRHSVIHAVRRVEERGRKFLRCVRSPDPAPFGAPAHAPARDWWPEFVWEHDLTRHFPDSGRAIPVKPTWRRRRHSTQYVCEQLCALAYHTRASQVLGSCRPFRVCCDGRRSRGPPLLLACAPSAPLRWLVRMRSPPPLPPLSLTPAAPSPAPRSGEEGPADCR